MFPQSTLHLQDNATQYLPKCVPSPLQCPTYITSKLVFSEFILNSDFFCCSEISQGEKSITILKYHMCKRNEQETIPFCTKVGT